jgi:hypothetical protein
MEQYILNVRVCSCNEWLVKRRESWTFSVHFIGFVISLQLVVLRIYLCSMERCTVVVEPSSARVWTRWQSWWTLFLPHSLPYMVMSWICVLWLVAVRRTYAATSASRDKGMAKLFKPLATLISVTHSPTYVFTYRNWYSVTCSGQSYLILWTWTMIGLLPFVTGKLK